MRLLDTHTLQLVDLFGVQETPRYVILSHTWGNDEVTYQEMSAGVTYNQLQQREGGRKVLGFCHRAAYYGYRLAWMDACCIDKSSSAELSETINSMYDWYARAEKCWVYLSDVEPVPVTDYVTANFNLNDRYREPFLASRWHTRGWTLQELLAPRLVEFLDKYWFAFGDRNSLAALITEVTRISEKFFDAPTGATLAQRMSWAARRETSRAEDIIYCLFGLLQVKLPTLYGEGPLNAFRRLQKELIDISDDASLLAWKNTVLQHPTDGGLATEIQHFETCVNVFLIGMPEIETFAMEKRGIHMTGFRGLYISEDDPVHVNIQPTLKKIGYPIDGRIVVLPLNCQCGPSADEMQQLCLVLLELYKDNYARVGCRKLQTPLDTQALTPIPPFYILRYGYMGSKYVYRSRTQCALGEFGSDDRYDTWEYCVPKNLEDSHSEPNCRQKDDSIH